MKATDRLQSLLNTCIEQYIKDAIPVTSLTLEAKPENDFSSATIRNDLKTLEQMGYLCQVYTSGGRVPTTLGYKSYIDSQPSASFVGDLVNDLYALTMLAERIEHKLGRGTMPETEFVYGRDRKKNLTEKGFQNVMTARRQNIYRLLEIPDVEMSAFYLILKEKIYGKK